MKTKIAHITHTENGIIEQDLTAHLTQVALLCCENMRKMQCPAMGYLVGLLHDLGKAGASFQHRMDVIRSGGSDPGQTGGHASAGAVLLNKLAGKQDNLFRSLALQAMCEAIFSHHTALPDNISPQGEDGYRARMQCDETELAEAEEYLWEAVISHEEFERLLRQAYAEAEALYKEIIERSDKPAETGFFLGMAEKMLLSSLIDADWLDSATGGELESPAADWRGGHHDRIAPAKALFAHCLNNLEREIQRIGQSPKPINVWRNYISDRCGEAGARKGSIYTLSCPTGAGKTLAVTRFALSHCIRQDKDRIFYIIPYLSVIDQTAKSIRKALRGENAGDSAMDDLVENSILELHSQVEHSGDPYRSRGDISTDGDFWAQRMEEPIVLTTMVRFLNTFFASGTRNLRPAHQFQNAVILFDEVQTLPVKQIALFNSLINYLTEFCGCTCVLCTATQPLLGETVKPTYPARIAASAALAELPSEAGDIFRRVRVEPQLKTGGYSEEELADFIWEKAQERGNLLAILNTRNCALALYGAVQKRAGEAYQVYYLSTKLYAAHRKSIIDEIRRALSDGEKIIVVSTQLIEAGIDFDFSCVVRSLAGMDSIVQAAGRCNREGLRGVETVYIVNPCEKLESLKQLKDIKVGAEASDRLLREFAENPAGFDGELLSEKAIQTYFRYYFWKRRSEMIYPVLAPSGHTLYGLLADNGSLVRSGVKHKSYEPRGLNQAFKTAAEQFRVIEEGGSSVFVPIGRGKEIWDEIQRSIKPGNAEYRRIKSLLKEAQQYVVNLRDHEIKELGKGVVQWADEMGMYVLNEMYYDEKAGITGEISGNMPIQMY